MIPNTVSFAYAHPPGTTYEDKEKTKVELRISATFYNPDMRAFYGKTSMPSKILLMTKTTNFSRYGVAYDTPVEFYFFAERISSKAPL